MVTLVRPSSRSQVRKVDLFRATPLMEQRACRTHPRKHRIGQFYLENLCPRSLFRFGHGLLMLPFLPQRDQSRISRFDDSS